MITRRDWLKCTAATGAAVVLPAPFLRGQTPAPMITRTIPASGEALPIIGLGGAATFGSLARSGELGHHLAELLGRHFGHALVGLDLAAGLAAHQEGEAEYRSPVSDLVHHSLLDREARASGFPAPGRIARSASEPAPPLSLDDGGAARPARGPAHDRCGRGRQADASAQLDASSAARGARDH